MKLKLPNASSPYGAAMGRRDSLPENTNATLKLRMEALRFVDGDYDVGGAYWGNSGGTRIYCAHGFAYHAIQDAEPIYVFVRAATRNEAKEKVREKLPNARFFK